MGKPFDPTRSPGFPGPFRVRLTCGADPRPPEEVVQDLPHIARMLGMPVEVVVNGVLLIVDIDDNVPTVVERWREAVDRRTASPAAPGARCRIYATACLNPALCDEVDACRAGDGVMPVTGAAPTPPGEPPRCQECASPIRQEAIYDGCRIVTQAGKRYVRCARYDRTVLLRAASVTTEGPQGETKP